MKSMEWYVKHDDFEGAMSRFYETSKNWKKRWFETICCIYDNNKKWSFKYIIDRINQTIKKIVNNIKQKTNKCKVSGRKGYVYLLKMFNPLKEWVFNKVGKSSSGGNLNKRMNQLKKEKYLDGDGDIELIKLYELPDEDSALILESYIRKYFKTKYHHIPNDRFEPFFYSEEDIKKCNKLYELTLTFC